MLGIQAKISVVVLVLVLLLPGVSHALTDEQKVLVGLKGIEVVIEEISPEAERLGLTRNQIQVDVELRLRKAGVRVLTKEEILETPGMPWLYVNLTIMFDKDFPIAAFSQQVELKEYVTLDRPGTMPSAAEDIAKKYGIGIPGFRTRGVIWDKSSTGTVGNKMIRALRETVDDEVDKFINDYLAANPKK
jgi:hypothetical protein